jgi:hypothetical protein
MDQTCEGIMIWDDLPCEVDEATLEVAFIFEQQPLPPDNPIQKLIKEVIWFISKNDSSFKPYSRFILSPQVEARPPPNIKYRLHYYYSHFSTILSSFQLLNFSRRSLWL